MNIMDKPTLKQIKKKYKNVKEVRCVTSGDIVNISKEIEYKIHYEIGCYWIGIKNYNGGSVNLYRTSDNKYAEIISYKEPLYQLTAKEVVHAYENPQWLKDTFKECFETELEVGRWYKNLTHKGSMFFNDGNLNYNKKSYCGYGFAYDGKWFDFDNNGNWDTENQYEPATEKEVEEALKNQSIKNGNVFCNWKFENNIFYGTDCCLNASGVKWNKLFDNGIWLDLTPTYTIPEAEKTFNIKIIKAV